MNTYTHTETDMHTHSPPPHKSHRKVENKRASSVLITALEGLPQAGDPLIWSASGNLILGH